MKYSCMVGSCYVGLLWFGCVSLYGGMIVGWELVDLFLFEWFYVDFFWFGFWLLYVFFCGLCVDDVGLLGLVIDL